MLNALEQQLFNSYFEIANDNVNEIQTLSGVVLACLDCVKVLLQALEVMCRGAKAEAEAVLKQMHVFAATVDSQLASAQATAAAAEAASRRCNRAATVEEVDVEAEEGGGFNQQSAPGDDATIDQIEDYFLQRQQVQSREASGIGLTLK